MLKQRICLTATLKYAYFDYMSDECYLELIFNEPFQERVAVHLQVTFSYNLLFRIFNLIIFLNYHYYHIS